MPSAKPDHQGVSWKITLQTVFEKCEDMGEWIENFKHFKYYVVSCACKCVLGVFKLEGRRSGIIR